MLAPSPGKKYAFDKMEVHWNKQIQNRKPIFNYDIYLHYLHVSGQRGVKSFSGA
jgi:hypothetical protein